MDLTAADLAALDAALDAALTVTSTADQIATGAGNDLDTRDNLHIIGAGFTDCGAAQTDYQRGSRLGRTARILCSARYA